VFFRGTLERFAHGHHFAGRFAASNRPGVRRAHHHAFENSLAADQRFFATFKGGQKLQRPPENARDFAENA
jgi:hypothetical protein